MESSYKSKCSFFCALTLWLYSCSEALFFSSYFFSFFFFFLKLQLHHKARRTNLFLLMSSVCLADLSVSLCAQRLPYTYTCPKKNYVYTVLTSTDTPRSKVSDWFRKIACSVDGIQIFFLLIWWHKCCFSLVFIVVHADDECSVWLKSPKDPGSCWLSSEMCFVICLCIDSQKNRLLVKGIIVPIVMGRSVCNSAVNADTSFDVQNVMGIMGTSPFCCVNNIEWMCYLQCLILI